MRIIAVLNTKGGTGKTTLTTCVAVRAARDFRVAVCDLDPQGSYGDWYKRRGSPENPALLRGIDRASDAAEALALTSPYDLVLMDGPPGSLLVTRDAVETADLVIIPMRASGFDIAASQDAIALCQETGTPFLVVINAKGQHDGKLVEQARGLLFAWKVPIAETVIAHRVAYINAATTGATGPEKDKKAAEEIDALWDEILGALPRKAKPRAVS